MVCQSTRQIAVTTLATMSVSRALRGPGRTECSTQLLASTSLLLGVLVHAIFTVGGAFQNHTLLNPAATQ